METLINIYIIEDNLMHKKVIMNKLEDYSNNSDFAKFNIVDIQNHIDFYHNLYVFPILSTDIFIIDIDLNTFFTGIQLAQKIRALHPYTYIIFLTGDSSNGIKVINDQIKPLAYLLKQDLQETVLNQEFYFILNQVEKNININGSATTF
ncbi:hypothetical protein [Enterococcus sp. UD-01]|jgi:two-component system response regulator AgrA|uniref:hypothetical protein n=1 Tax=Enterococcus sp. UD-01 TaxID=3373911 RepID=UPI00383923BD